MYDLGRTINSSASSSPNSVKKDLSEIAGWVGPTKKGMGVESLARVK